jgi:uncharacterized protein (TIGR03643 family)
VQLRISNIISMSSTMKHDYSDAFINDIIRMAWADEISFDKIKRERGISEAEVVAIMRRNLKTNSFKLWRKRVSGRSSKHEKRAILLNAQE